MMYVIQTKSGCESAVSSALKRLGFDIKVPTPEDYYKIKNTDGVINFLGKGKPSAVTEDERQYINWLWNGGKNLYR